MPPVALSNSNVSALNNSARHTSSSSSNKNGAVESNPLRGTRWNVPSVASSKVDALLSQFLHTQEWSVAFPAPMTEKLMHYVPTCVENAFAFPGASTDNTDSSFSASLVGDTEMLSHGMLEEIPLAHFLLHPDRDRELEEASKQMEKRDQEVAEAHLNVPFRNAKARNPDLPDEDFELVDVDFATPHKSRDLPSLNYLINPVYTEIGFRNVKQRHQDRLSAIIGSANSKVDGSSASTSTGGSGGGDSSMLTPADRAEKWKENQVKTFKNAKAFDASFGSLMADIAAKKLGILLRSEIAKGGADMDLAIGCVKHLFTILAFVTSNGTSMGTGKNNTNVDRSSYNSLQGRFIASALWSEVCKVAKQATEASKAGGSVSVTAEAIGAAFAATARMPSEGDDETAAASTSDGFRGDCAVRGALRKEVLEWAQSYLGLVAKATHRAAAKGEFVNTDHTEEDMTVLNLPAELVALSRLGDDLVPLSVPPMPLLLGTNVNIPALYSQLTTNKERKTTTGAVPVAVLPLFPEGFEQASRPEYTTSAEGEVLAPIDAIRQARTHAFGSISKDGDVVSSLRRITLDGEKNGFAVAPYTPSTVRIPHVLLHNPSGKSVDEVDRDHKVYLQPMSFNPDSNQDMTMGAVPFTQGSTTSYLSRPVSADYEEYYADPGCTINYLMKVVPEGAGKASLEGMESLPASVQGFVMKGGYATYQRVPAFSRYRRTATSASKSAGKEKCVTVSWGDDEEGAKEEQLAAIGSKRPRDSATTVE